MMPVSQVSLTHNNDCDRIQETGLCWLIQRHTSVQPKCLYTRDGLPPN